MNPHYFSAYAGLPRNVYFLFAARLVNSMGYFVSPLLTLILTQKLGMGKAEAGSAMALLLLTQAPCVILGGRLADTVGRKRALLYGSLAGAAFYLACGCGLTGKAMAVCIILAADCTAVAVPAFDTLLADLTRPEERQSAYSLMYLGVNIGMAASPLLGGLLFRRHLPLLFLLDAATTLGAMAIVAAKVPETVGGARHAAGHPPRAALGTVLRQAPVLMGFLALLFLEDFCYSQWNFMLPAQFGDLFAGAGARRYSVLSSVNAVTVIALTPLITQLTHRLRPLRAMAATGLFYLAAYLGFCAGGPFPVYLALAVLFTLGEIGATIQIGAFLSSHAPPACLGQVNALSTLLRGAAAALGPLLMGQLLAGQGYFTGWLATAILTGAAVSGFFLLDRRDTTAPPSGREAPR